MNVREAKDFLVNQAAQQAAIDGVSLSDLEKRMMYFSESDTTCEDPIALNAEFEAHYNSEEYEAKISRLLHNACKRLKKDDSQSAKRWDQAIRELRKGDHYLLVLWSSAPGGARPPHDQLKLFAWAMLIAFVLLAVSFLLNHFGIWFGPRHRNGRGFDGVQSSAPSWLQRPVLLLLAAGYFYAVIWPFLTKRSPALKDWMAKNFSGRVSK